MRTTRASFRWRALMLGGGAAVLALVFLTNASSQEGKDQDEPVATPSQTFIGKLEGGPASARIGVVVEQGNFLVYMCSQDQKFNQGFSRWLKGKIGDGGSIEAASPDGVKVTAALKGDMVQGEATDGGGAGLKFKATKISNCQAAGIYRAVDNVAGDEVVAGWIVDTDDAIAGNVNNNNKKINQLPPKLGKNNNLGGVLAQGGNNVDAERVSTPLKGGTKKGGKVDPATRAENLNGLAARFKGKKNGSPLHAAVLNVLRRSQTGAKGNDATDTSLLNEARKINPKSVSAYLKDWEALPVALRSNLLGSSASLADGKTGLDKSKLDLVLNALKTKRTAAAEAAAKAPVKNVQIRQLVCVDETIPRLVGADEIFVLYTAIQGTTVFTPQKTKIYTGLDSGETVSFTGADVTVFPPPGQQPGAGEVEIAAGVFEDDSIDNAAIANLVAGATNVAVAILKASGKEAFVDVAESLNDFFDTFVAGLPSTQFLGSDVIVARGNGQLRSIGGQPKTSMTVQRFLGNTKTRLHRYDLSNIVVAK